MPKTKKEKVEVDKKVSSDELAHKIKQSLNKKYGAEIAPDLKESKALAHIPYGITSASIIDAVIGRPGFPAGRVTEIFGKEASAKSTVAFHALAETQRRGGIAILVETEQAFEVERLKKLGLNLDTLILLSPLHMEQAFELMALNINKIRESGFTGPVCIVFDSIAQCPTMAEVNATFKDKQMATAARVISQSFRKIVRMIAETKTVLILLNQMKANFDKYSGETHITYGGKSISYAATLRIQLKTRKKDVHEENKEAVGIDVSVINIKNKLEPPYKKLKFYLSFKDGIDVYEDCRMFGLAVGAIRDKGQGHFVLGLEDHELIRFTRLKWIETVDKHFGDPRKLRDLLTKEAITNGYLMPYGLSKKERKEQKKKMKALKKKIKAEKKAKAK